MRNMSNSRVPIGLVDEKTIQDPVAKEVFGRISKGTSVGVVNLHRAIANSPKVFDAFLAFAHALRHASDLDPLERELAILRVLERHGGHYEHVHHTKMAIAAGATEAQLAGQLDARKSAILAYVDAYSAGHGVAPAVADAVAKELNDRQRIELTLTIGLYMSLAHFSNALDLPLD